jgi:hypothetical protein
MEPKIAEKRPISGTNGTSDPSKRELGQESLAGDAQDRLDCWQDVADYVGRDKRTAMRWAKEQGMPVHRIPGSKRSRIYASRAEISRWLAKCDQSLISVTEVESDVLPTTDPPATDLKVTLTSNENVSVIDIDPTSSKPEDSWVGGLTPRLRALGYTVVASLIILAVGIFLYASAPGEPASCEVAVNTLIVRDGEGQEVWRNEFHRALDKHWYSNARKYCNFADLNGDGIPDVLFDERPASFEIDSDVLNSFITRSRIWRKLNRSPIRAATFTPGAPLVVGPSSDPTHRRAYDEYVPPYTIFGIFSEQSQDGKPRIIVLSGMVEAPGQVAVLDRNLTMVSEYWHTGHLKSGQFANDNGQDRIFLGGVNNGYHAATLVSFDPKRISGTTDLTLNAPHQDERYAITMTGQRGHLTPLGTGSETCRVIFERSCIGKTQLYLKPYNRVLGFSVTPEHILVTVVESEHEEAPERILYELDRHMNFVDAVPNTEFRQRHRELERAGLLDHVFDVQELRPLVHVLPGCEFISKNRVEP